MTIHKNTEIKSAILDRVTLVGKQGSAVKDLVPRIVCGAPRGNQSWEKAFQALEEDVEASNSILTSEKSFYRGSVVQRILKTDANGD